MISGLFAYWLIALPLGYYFAFALKKGLIGFWTSLLMALILLNLMLGFIVITLLSNKTKARFKIIKKIIKNKYS